MSQGDHKDYSQHSSKWSQSREDLLKLMIVLQDGPQIHLDRLPVKQLKEKMDQKLQEVKRRKSITDRPQESYKEAFKKMKERFPVSIDRRKVPDLDPNMIDAIQKFHVSRDRAGPSDNVEKSLEKLFEESKMSNHSNNSNNKEDKKLKIDAQSGTVTPKSNQKVRKEHQPSTPKSGGSKTKSTLTLKRSDVSPISKRDMKMMNLFGDSPKKKRPETIIKRRRTLNDLPTEAKIRKIEQAIKTAKQHVLKDLKIPKVEDLESARIATGRLLYQRCRCKAKKLPMAVTSTKYEILKIPPPRPLDKIPTVAVEIIRESVIVDLTEDKDYYSPITPSLEYMTYEVKKELLERNEAKTDVAPPAAEPLTIDVPTATTALSMPEMPSPIKTPLPVLPTIVKPSVIKRSPAMVRKSPVQSDVTVAKATTPPMANESTPMGAKQPNVTITPIPRTVSPKVTANVTLLRPTITPKINVKPAVATNVIRPPKVNIKPAVTPPNVNVQTTVTPNVNIQPAFTPPNVNTLTTVTGNVNIQPTVIPPYVNTRTTVTANVNIQPAVIPSSFNTPTTVTPNVNIRPAVTPPYVNTQTTTVTPKVNFPLDFPPVVTSNVTVQPRYSRNATMATPVAPNVCVTSNQSILPTLLRTTMANTFPMTTQQQQSYMTWPVAGLPAATVTHQAPPPSSYNNTNNPQVLPATSLVPILPALSSVRSTVPTHQPVRVPYKSPPVISIPEKAPSGGNVDVAASRAPPLLQLINTVQNVPQNLRTYRNSRLAAPPLRVISNDDCCVYLHPTIYKMLCLRKVGQHLYECLRDQLGVKGSESESYPFNTFYLERLKANGSALLKQLQSVTVRDFDLLYVMDCIGKKIYRDTIATAVHRCHTFSVLGSLLEANADLCTTQFTKTLRMFVKTVCDRMNNYKSNFSQEQLVQLRHQILTYGEIAKKSWELDEFYRKREELEKKKREMQVMEVKKRLEDRHNRTMFLKTLEKRRKLEQHVQYQLQRPLPVPPPSVNYTENLVINTTSRTNLQTPPTTPDTSNTPPVNVMMTTPPVATMTPPTTAEGSPLVEVVSPPASPLENPVPKLEQLGVEPISPGSPIDLVTDDEDSDVKPKIEVKDEVAAATTNVIGPQSDDEIQTIDLTWMEDVDPQEMWQEMADDVPIKVEERIDVTTVIEQVDGGNDGAMDEEDARDSVSPSDSGLGSPKGADSNNGSCEGYKCLCGKLALFVCACNQSTYCSRECQVLHWPEHQRICERISSGSR